MGDDDDLARLRRKPPERAARAVPLAGAGFWTAAEIMHVTGIPWLDITLGSLAASGVAYGKGARGGAAWFLAAGAWSALGARLGPLADPGWYFPLTQAWAVLTFAGWRWARVHPAVVEARDRRLASADWLGRGHRLGLKGSHLLHHEKTRLGERMIIDVKGTGKRASAFAHSDVAERIAEDEGLPVSRVQVKPHRLAGKVEISIRRVDPWARPIPHPVLDPDPEIVLPERRTIRQPIAVGQDPETGVPLNLPLWDQDGTKNVLVVGIKGAGKSVLLSNIREGITAAQDAILIDINLSKALEDREWAPAAHLTALGRHQAGRALRLLREANKIIEFRSQAGQRETAVFVPSPSDPLIVVMLDEIDTAARIPAIRQELQTLTSKDRSEGVAFVGAGQRGTAEWIGGGDLRSQLDLFCVGQVNRRGEAMHAAGEIGLEMPDMASYGEGHKGVWAIAELGGEMQVGRTFNLKEPLDIRRLAAERAHRQPDLKPELKTFLGDSYANLLSTDVFARWAHEQQERAPVIAAPRTDAASPDSAAAEPGTVATTTALDAYDREAEDHLATLGPDDDLRRRWIEQGKRNDETRRMIAETAAMPEPDISHEDQIAHAAARWRQVGEQTEIPDDKRERLLELLAAGTTARIAGEALGVTPWIARTYLERLRLDRQAHTTGKGRAARWVAGPEPESGDAP